MEEKQFVDLFSINEDGSFDLKKPVIMGSSSINNITIYGGLFLGQTITTTSIFIGNTNKDGIFQINEIKNN